MKDEVNVNLNSCLVERDNIGSYEYINKCTGEINKIDWGYTDWIVFSITAITIIEMIVIIIALMKEFIRK